MDYEWLLSLLQQFSYAALFFALWLGIVGMPIPDEVETQEKMGIYLHFSETLI